MRTDIAIIGSGPAGLFAAYELVKNTNYKITIIECGKEPLKRKCLTEETAVCQKCSPCNVLCGVGGAGILSAGRLNLRPDIGGNLEEFVSKKEANELVTYIDSIFLGFGAPKHVYGENEENIELKRKAASAGVKFIPIKQRFIGTNKSPKLVDNFMKHLQRKGVNFLLGRKAETIKKEGNLFKVKVSKETITSKYLIVCPGRYGANWLAKQAKKLGLPVKYAPIDVGVRVEVPSIILEEIIKVNIDPKFHIYTKTYDDFTRTFCVNHKGFVVKEVYEDLVLVNGHAYTDKTSNTTNFAFLVRITLTEPTENTTDYGRKIAKVANILGGGKPILQKMGDLERGRRSTWKRIKEATTKPTLLDVTPGDLAMILPHRILTDIMEGLEKLSKVIPGVTEDSTLLYAPEIKFSANRIITDKNLETPIENLFVAGDGAGVSRGIVIAAATGIIAARGIIKKAEQQRNNPLNSSP